METLILAVLLNMPVTPVCQQWIDRVDQESRAAARLVWSPQKERHIERMNQAARKARESCYADPGDDGNQVADARPLTLHSFGGAGF